MDKTRSRQNIEVDEWRPAAYWEGYKEGYERGYKEGYEQGYKEGLRIALKYSLRLALGPTNGEVLQGIQSKLNELSIEQLKALFAKSLATEAAEELKNWLDAFESRN